MLELKKINVSFHDRPVLQDFTCCATCDDFIMIMGANGAGKSTLFDVISGKKASDSGQVILDSQDISSFSEEKRALMIGRLFQNPSFGCVPSMTIRENLSLATFKNRSLSFSDGLNKFPEKVVEEVLKPLGLNIEKLLDVPMGVLSGGQRQIVSFIMATLIPPKVLLLDEPTAALDPKSATELLIFAKKFSETYQIPILMITHDPLIAKNMGNKLWIIEGGKVHFEFGKEKENMHPEEFFSHIDYQKICRTQ